VEVFVRSHGTIKLGFFPLPIAEAARLRTYLMFPQNFQLLSKAEEMDPDAIWRYAAEIPEEWYEGDRDDIHRLVEALYNRRRLIRRLIGIFRESTRNPFPNWRDVPTSINLAAVGREEGIEIR
jgi:hypothetical protein